MGSVEIEDFLASIRIGRNRVGNFGLRRVRPVISALHAPNLVGVWVRTQCCAGVRALTSGLSHRGTWRLRVTKREEQGDECGGEESSTGKSAFIGIKG